MNRQDEVAVEQPEVILLPPAQYEAFVDALNHPPKANDSLKVLMQRKAPWETHAE